MHRTPKTKLSEEDLVLLRSAKYGALRIRVEGESVEPVEIKQKVEALCRAGLLRVERSEKESMNWYDPRDDSFHFRTVLQFSPTAEGISALSKSGH